MTVAQVEIALRNRLKQEDRSWKLWRNSPKEKLWVIHYRKKFLLTVGGDSLDAPFICDLHRIAGDYGLVMIDGFDKDNCFER